MSIAQELPASALCAQHGRRNPKYDLATLKRDCKGCQATSQLAIDNLTIKPTHVNFWVAAFMREVLLCFLKEPSGNSLGLFVFAQTIPASDG